MRDEETTKLSRDICDEGADVLEDLLPMLRMIGVVLDEGEHVLKDVAVSELAERNLLLGTGDKTVEGISILIIKVVRNRYT